MAKTLKMVSKDGKHELEVDEDNKVEITQRRAEGWTLKSEKKADTK